MLTLRIDAKKLSDNESYWVYNGLDGMVTVELLEALLPKLDDTTRLTYHRAMDIQAPALEMMFRGIKLNRRICDLRVEVLRKQQQRLLDILNRFAWAIWEKPLNPASPKQLEEFFYEYIGVPVIKERKAGNVWGPSTSREALEKMCDHLLVAPICRTILAWRDCAKKISVLTTEIDEDGHIRCSYGVAATTTGRFASRTSAFATGTNLQNITGELRDAFEATAGKKMTYIDLEQAESRLVGLLAWLCTGKSNYLDACESGDLHTTVCRMTWTDLGWNGEKEHDRAIADRIFYRSYSYRDLAKRAGHGSNYFGKPPTIAKHTKIPTELAREFQLRYFKAFPEIPEWHAWVRTQLQTTGTLTSVMGRQRHFFDRLTDDSTLRAAIAFSPQSAIGDILNLGMFQIWKAFPDIVELLAQIHDAILAQYHAQFEDEIVPKMLQTIRVPLAITHPVTGETRQFAIPSDCMTGWNWGYERTFEDIRKSHLKQVSKGITRPRLPAYNPNGLRKYKPGTSDPRKFIPLDEQLAQERQLWRELDYAPKW